MYPTHGEQQKKEIETIRKRTTDFGKRKADRSYSFLPNV